MRIVLSASDKIYSLPIFAPDDWQDPCEPNPCPGGLPRCLPQAPAGCDSSVEECPEYMCVANGDFQLLAPPVCPTDTTGTTLSFPCFAALVLVRPARHRYSMIWPVLERTAICGLFCACNIGLQPQIGRSECRALCETDSDCKGSLMCCTQGCSKLCLPPVRSMFLHMT